MEEDEASSGRGEEGGYVGCGGWVGVDVFEVAGLFFLLDKKSLSCEEEKKIACFLEKKASILQGSIRPLRLFDNVQACMDNELIHVLRRLWEPETRDAIATGL